MTRFLAGLFTAFAMLTAPAASAAPEAELWPRWTAHDPASGAEIDHAPWDAFLRKYVRPGPDGVNRVPYRDVAAADRVVLNGYIDRLAALPISRFGRDEQMAYWINLYNALTLRLILAHYPVDSIRDIDISPGWFSDGPWGRKLVRIEGIELSLDDIEHRILRPIWRDARIHYAVNCASVGCPNLRRHAYTGPTLHAMLNRAARDYVNNWRGARFDGDRLVVSSLYKWYPGDFGGDPPSIISHLRSYAAPALAERLSKAREFAGYVYDWALNDGSPSP